MPARVINTDAGVQIRLYENPAAPPVVEPITYEKTGSIISDAVVSSTDVLEATETGSVISDRVLSGAKVREFGERAGVAVSETVLSGTDVFESPETGSLISNSSTLSGADVFTAAEAGSVISALVAAGVDVDTIIRTGSPISALVASGADVLTAAEAGTIISGSTVSGVTLLDNFNRSDGDVGPAWAQIPSINLPVLIILSNQLKFEAAARVGAWNLSTYGADVEVSYTIKVTDAGGGAHSYLLAQMPDPAMSTFTGYVLDFRILPAAYTWTLFCIVVMQDHSLHLILSPAFRTQSETFLRCVRSVMICRH